jgi:transcriptional regulator with XRE-family HTH domain
MPQHKTYDSVTDLAAAMGASAEFTKKLANELARRTIVDHLIALRGAKGFSQKDIADRMGCTQSKVSKLESSDDGDLKIDDLRQNASAIGLNMGLFLAERQLRALDRIKFHAFQIRNELSRLVELAKGDSSITDGVAHVHGETCFNVVKLIGKSLEALLQASAETLPNPADDESADNNIRVEMRVLPKGAEPAPA